MAKEYKNRCGPAFVRKDSFVVCPWMADLRRAPPAELRSALMPVKKHLPPLDASGLEVALRRGSPAPSDGTSLFSTSAQMCGSGNRAEEVDMGSVVRIRPSRARHKRYKYLLSDGVQLMGRASEDFL